MSNLESYLSGLSPLELQQLATLWGYPVEFGELVAAQPRLEHEGRLLDIMRSKQAARLVVSVLDSLAARTADVIGMLGRSNVARDRMALILLTEGASRKEVEETIDRLIAICVVEEEGNVVRLVKETGPGIRAAIRDLKDGRGIVPYPQLLKAQGSQALQSLVRLYGLRESLPRIDEASVAAELEDATTIEHGLAGVSANARRLYTYLAGYESVPTQDLPQALQLTMPHVEDALRALQARALAFDGFDSSGQRIIFLPSEVARSERPTEEPVETAVVAGPDLREVEPGADTVTQTYDLLWDMVLILGIIQQGGVYLTQSETFPKRSLAGVAKVFRGQGEQYDDRATDVLEYTSALGLIDYGGDSAISITMAGREWMRLDAAQQTRRLLDIWMSDAYGYSPFYFSGFGGYYPMPNEILQAHRRLVHWLQECTPGVWYSMDSFMQLVRKRDFHILRTKGRGGIRDMKQHWDQVEGLLLKSWMASDLVELGIINIGLKESEIRGSPIRLADRFEVSDVGMAALRNQPLPVSDQPLLVQPNFEVIVFEFNLPALYAIIPFCTPLSFDRAATFKLSKESVLQGAIQGLSAAQMQATLERYSQKPLPQNVIYSLGEWAGKLKKVRLSIQVVLEAEDEESLQELESSKSLRQRVARRLGPKAVVLKSGATIRQQVQTSNREMNRLAQTLTKAGFTVDVDTRGEGSS